MEKGAEPLRALKEAVHREKGKTAAVFHGKRETGVFHREVFLFHGRCGERGVTGGR